LTTRATALKLSGGLPDNVSAEYYITAGYLLNRIPTRRIGYRTPIGGFLEKIGDANWKPNRVQIRVFGCRAYTHNQTRNKLDKLDPKAHIGWLVGYESSNIWRIWIPSLHRVISTRDVKFDETRRYSDKNEPIEAPEAEEVVRVIEIPSLDLRSEEDSVLENYELSIDALADTKYQTDFVGIIGNFRNYWRNKRTLPKPRGRHGAFAVAGHTESDEESPNPTLNGKDKDGKRINRYFDFKHLNIYAYLNTSYTILQVMFCSYSKPLLLENHVRIVALTPDSYPRAESRN
jgi:hypothetical protein